MTVKSGTISLKAESVAEREQWIQAIKGMIGGAGRRYLDSDRVGVGAGAGEMSEFIMEIEDSMIENS